MDRYQHIVRLSFYGHVHEERHNVIRGINSDLPVGVEYWSGAMTTYTYSYPSFRRFIVDAETMLPIKVETWRVDVEAQNPEFILDHELTDYYQLPDLSPASFDALSKKFKDDSELSLKYQ